MVTPQLVTYVATQLQRTSRKVLERTLLTSGWQQTDVEQVLSFVGEKLTAMRRFRIIAVTCGALTILSIIGALLAGQLFPGATQKEVSQGDRRTLASAGSGPSFYVSPSGSDSNAGTLTEPFATLAKAKSEVRGEVGATVYVRAGTYQLDVPLIFDAQDSGSEESPNIWRNYPGEYPVITGSKKITLDPGLTGTISLPMSQFGLTGGGSGTVVHAVYYNAAAQTLARTPNATTPNYGNTDPWANHFASVSADSGNRTEVIYSASEVGSALLKDPTTWTSVTSGKVQVYSGPVYWPDKVSIASVDATKITLNGSSSYNLVNTTYRNRFYVENIPELLDAPGEWYQGSGGSNLQFILPPGTTNGTETISVAWTSSPLQFTGTQYVEFHNLSLKEFGWGTVSSIDGGSLIKIDGSDHLTFDGMVISGSEGMGFYVVGLSNNLTIRNSSITNLKRSAIQLGPEPGYVYFKALTSANMIIENNYIAHIGFGGHQAAKGILANMFGTVIRNNVITDMEQQGIIGDRGHGEVVVEGNRISNVNRLIRDSAAIYFIPFSDNVTPAANVRSFLARGDVIRGNFVSDTGGYAYDSTSGAMKYGINTWGIYLDDNQGDSLVENNIVARTFSECFLIHTGSDNIVRNNICYSTTNQLGQFRLAEDFQQNQAYFDAMNAEVDNLPTNIRNAYIARYPSLALLPATEVRGTHMVRNNIQKNIFYSGPGATAAVYFHYWLGANNTINNNLYYLSGGRTPVTAGNFSDGYQSGDTTWAYWQGKGFDANSQFADPLFTDAANDDFTLQAGSPALSVGFNQIDQASIGLTSVVQEVASVSTGATMYSIGDTVGVAWPAPSGNGYKEYRSQLRTSGGTPLTSWLSTGSLSETYSTATQNPGSYIICVAVKNDIRIPDTQVPSDWGSEECSASFILAAAALQPTPSPVVSAGTTPTPSPSATATAAPKVQKSSSATPTPGATEEVSQETSPSSEVSPETSPSPSASAPVVLRASPSPSVGPEVYPEEPVTTKGQELPAQVGFSLLALLSAAGATFATTTLLSTRHLLGLP
ncbi:hypothetical protein BH11PAT4_BH11PAT4_1160 [soil metagenome]